MSSGEDIRADRLKKLELLHAAGMEAYPATSARDSSIPDLLANFDEFEANGMPKTIAGRVMSKRGQGGIAFADLYDGEGRLQIVLQADSGADIELFSSVVDTGDFIEATGVAFKTKRGEQSLKVREWRMLAKSLAPMPSEWFGIKDDELKLRQRYLDILLNPEVRAMFERRTRFWQAIRSFYFERGFIEVESPILESCPGGAEARPFITHHNALDIDVYLRIALELWHKRLTVAGFSKVFEIGRVFRNEGQSREHLQDFTFLESYEAFSDMQKGMVFIQELYRHIVKKVYGRYSFTIHDHNVDFAEEWPQLDFTEKLQEHFGLNPLTCTEAEAIAVARRAGVLGDSDNNKTRAVDQLWKKIRKTISGPAFLVGVPVYLEPLAKRSKENPDVVERFQVIIAGSEVGKGFSELNDPLDQRARFEEQQRMRDEGDDEAQRLDEEYLQAMEYGMPPLFGFGVSERLFAFLENKPIHETQLFPLLRPKQESLSKKAAEQRYRSKRFVVIADPYAGYGVTANAIGQLGISIGGFSKESLFDTTTLTDADGHKHYVDGLYPMANLAGDQKAMATFMLKCYEADIQVFDFSDVMRKAHSDDEMLKGYAAKKTADIGYIAVGALVPADFEKEFLSALQRFE